MRLVVLDDAPNVAEQIVATFGNEPRHPFLRREDNMVENLGEGPECGALFDPFGVVIICGFTVG